MGAVGEIQGIARFKIHEGKLDEFKRLSARCIEVVRAKDTGTLQYDIYLNDDQTEALVHERYRDSEALIEHFENLGDLAAAVLATGSVSGELLGHPTPTLRAALAPTNVTIFTPTTPRNCPSIDGTPRRRRPARTSMAISAAQLHPRRVSRPPSTGAGTTTRRQPRPRRWPGPAELPLGTRPGAPGQDGDSAPAETMAIGRFG